MGTVEGQLTDIPAMIASEVNKQVVAAKIGHHGGSDVSWGLTATSAGSSRPEFLPTCLIWIRISTEDTEGNDESEVATMWNSLFMSMAPRVKALFIQSSAMEATRILNRTVRVFTIEPMTKVQ